MSAKLKRKILLLTIVIGASMLVMGTLLGGMQEGLSIASYDEEMAQEADQLVTLLEEADAETAQNKETFDAIYQSKAQSVAFMAANDAGFEPTDAKMAEYQQLLDVDNIMVVRADGSVVAQAQPTKANFSYARFNYLRECLATGEPSRAVEIELPEEDWLDRYYAAKLDDETMVVVEQSPTELRELIETTGSIQSVLANISLGQGGYVFALSAQTYLITYHPQSEIMGTDALDAGIDVTDLEDGNICWMDLNGQRLYTRVSLIGDTYYAFAIPASDMAATRNITVAVILFTFFMVMVTVSLYGVFVMHQNEREEQQQRDLVSLGSLRFNRVIAKRCSVLALAGILAILVVSFYMQTLFALSSQSVVNNERASSIAETIERTRERADDLTSQYNERYLSKARVAAYILTQNPSLATKPKMQELADALQVANVYRFDLNGDMVASNAPYEHFTLSEDPESQSYAFRQLLQGVDEFVQEPMPDDTTGALRQYIGIATYDDQGFVDGFVQIGIRADRLETLLETVQIDRVLDGVKAGADGFAFAIDKSDNTVAYYPDAMLIGKSATDIGLTEHQLKGGYDDYLTIDGVSYFGSSIETPDYYVYVAGSEGALMAQRLPLTLTCAGIALACMALTFLLLTLEPARNTMVARIVTAEKGDGRIFDILTPSGRTAQTESAASRWLNRSLAWDQMTPEQKLGYVLRVFIGVGVACVFVAVLLRDRVFGSDSVFGYILGGSWERGLNIFAVTASIMTACVIFTISWLVQKLLHLLSGVLSARGETVCRLLVSLTKYGAILGVLYWCLATVGVDTNTLLASAGLLTLAISFGAKDLVTDLLCGLFIIFEGEFRVGDTISVGSNTGTVMEIGIRTTKINDGDGNVIVLRNSAISNVINRTKMDSYASVDIDVTVGEDLPYLENVLKDELPLIARRQRMIIDGPYYKGIVALSSTTMTIRLVATCAEKDRGALERALKREMRLLLTRHGISPYQLQFEHDKHEEVMDHEEAEELREADEFAESQSGIARDLGNQA